MVARGRIMRCAPKLERPVEKPLPPPERAAEASVAISANAAAIAASDRPHEQTASKQAHGVSLRTECDFKWSIGRRLCGAVTSRQAP